MKATFGAGISPLTLTLLVEHFVLAVHLLITGSCVSKAMAQNSLLVIGILQLQPMNITYGMKATFITPLPLKVR